MKFAKKASLAPLMLASFAGALMFSGAANAWSDSDDSSQSQPRVLDAFDAIQLDDSTDLDITIGGTQSVVVKADPKLLDHIGTSVRGHTLVVESVESRGYSYWGKHSPKISITIPALSKLEIDGSGDARITGLDGKSLVLSVRGSGDIVAHGKADALDIDVQGSGDVDLHDVEAASAKVVVHGSGDVRVHASQALDATINGSGDIRYGGNPAQLKTHVNGSGDISRD